MEIRALLERVKERILADPKSYNQQTFCGTVCCIAGHIDIVLNGAEKHVLRGSGSREAIEQIESIATEAIGGDPGWLFNQVDEDPDPDGYWDEDEDDTWPIDLSIEYMGAPPESRARVACKAIDQWMRERGI